MFLPVSIADMKERGWDEYDFLLITGDAYVDHPSFGAAVIGRLLEADGYRVAVMAQPDWKNPVSYQALGRPRLAALITSGNIDSMVAHYTAAKRLRHSDSYSPGGKAGKRPDRALTVYSNGVRNAYPDLPIILGGLEASLRRFAHYDYWDDSVHRSVLEDCKADILVYGMGEYPIVKIASRLAAGDPVSEITDIRGTCVLIDSEEQCHFEFLKCAPAEKAMMDKRSYAESTRMQYREQDPVIGRAILQGHGDRYLLQNPPSPPITTREFDRVAELPYMRMWHPMYADVGGVPAIEEVEFSIIHNRGCFGACNFCSLAFHQGRVISSRSHDSVLREAKQLVKNPGFKGYIHDVGGPTANFRRPACKKQLKLGLCKNRRCLAPTPCENLDADQSDYLQLLRKLRAIDGVKKVFIRSGIRFDYLLADKNSEFFAELVQHHISGQLKVAPEHVVNSVLDYMGKPPIETYNAFVERFKELNQRYGKEQYLVPYLISSHPGCTLSDAVELAVYLNRIGHMPEQVQDFYPTPGTLSTCMYYTEIDPRTMKPVYVPKTAKEKAMQRALLQWRKPENRPIVLQALRDAGREDLIGFEKGCLIRPFVKNTKKPNQTAEASSGKGRPATLDSAQPARRNERKPEPKGKQSVQNRSGKHVPGSGTAAAREMNSRSRTANRKGGKPSNRK